MIDNIDMEANRYENTKLIILNVRYMWIIKRCQHLGANKFSTLENGILVAKYI